MGILGGRKDDAIICWWVEYPLKSAGPYKRLRCAGPEEPDPISCLTMEGDAIWAASGVHVVKYVRGKEVSMFILSP